MNLEKIQEEWAVDAQIDRTELLEESLKIPHLHSKYFKILSRERLTLRKMEIDFKTLKLEKEEFYTMGPTKETQDKGWEFPARGKIVKSEVGKYLDVDQHLVEMVLKLALQDEKVKFLESILNSLNNRSFQISNALKWLQLTSGGI